MVERQSDCDQSYRSLSVQQCCWAFSPSSDEVCVSVLCQCRESYQLQLVSGKVSKPMLQSIVEEPNLSLWSASVPRTYLRTGDVHFYLSIKEGLSGKVSSWIGFSSPQDNQSVSAVKDNPRFSHIFVFNLKLQRNPSTFVAIPAEKQLAYMATALLRSPDYTATIPQLVLQYVPSEKSEYREARMWYDAIEKLAAEDRLCAAYAGCVFAVMGLPKLNASCKPEAVRYERLLSFANEEFLQHLLGCQEGQFVSAVLQGVAHAVALEMNRSSESWLPALQSLTAVSSLAFRLLAATLEKVVKLTDQHALALAEAVLKTEGADCRILVPKLLEKVCSAASVFRVLDKTFPVYQFSEENKACVKKNLERTQRGKMWSSTITESEINEILDVLKDKPENFKEFFYQSDIPGLIHRKIERIDKGEILLHKRLFLTDYDFKLMSKFKLDDFLPRACQAYEAPFAMIINEFAVPEPTASLLLDKWLQTTTYRSDDSTMISKIDTELESINDKSMVPSLCAKVSEYLATRFPLFDNISSMAKAIDEAKNTDLKNVFVNHPATLSKFGDQKDNKVKQLLIEKDKNPASHTLGCLLKYLLGMSQAPTYEEVEFKFINSAEIEYSWKSLMKDYNQYRTYSIAINLQKVLQQFALNALSGNLSIEKILRLSAKSLSEQVSVAELLSEAFTVTHQLHESKDVLQGVHNTINDAKRVVKQLDTLRFFSEAVLSLPSEAAEVQEALTACQDSYKTTILSEFQFPPLLAELLPAAEVVTPFAHSSIFKQCLLSLQREAPISRADSHDASAQAIRSTLLYVKDILDSLHTLKISEMLHRLGGVEDWRAEIEVLIAAKDEWRDDLRRLEDGLTCYYARKDLAKHCVHILDLLEALQVDDHGLSSRAEQFRKVEPRARTMTLKAFQQEFRTAESALFFSRQQGNTAFGVISELVRTPELLRFLTELSEERLKYLLECVNDYDESTLTTQLVLELETVWQFYSELRNAGSQLIPALHEKLATQRFRDVEQQIRVCASHMRAFWEMSVELERKEEAKRKQIESLCRLSTATFELVATGYDAKAQFPDNRRGPFDLASLLELKDRASLTIHASHVQEDSDDLCVLRKFVEFVQELQKTVKTLNNLRVAGYPVDMVSSNAFECVEGRFEALLAFDEEAGKVLQAWTTSLETAYLKSFQLTFLFGMQLWTVEERLVTGTQSLEARNLLAYMERSAGQHRGEIPPADTPVDRLMRLAEMLEALPKDQCDPVEVIYNVPTKARIAGFRGSVLYATVPADRVLHALVSVYMHSTHEFPRPHQVMHCTRATLWAELQAFLYRCFTSANSEIYALIGGEKLSLELQTAFRSLFAKLASMRQATLAVITSDETCLLAEYFQSLEEPRTIRVRDSQLISDEHVLGHIVRQLDSRVGGSPTSQTVVVRSLTSGQGKSSWIRTQATRQGKPLTKLPIAGDIDLAEFGRDLLEKVKAESVLHLTLSHVDHPDVVNDLITDICLLRTVRAGDLVVVFPISCRVFIEVQNLQPELPVPMLQYLTQEVIQFDIQRIELTDDIRFVTAYLQLHETKKLSRGDIGTVAVSVESAARLISKYFLEPQGQRGQPISFLAVSTFVRVLSALLKRLELSPFTPLMIDFMVSDAEAAGVPQLKKEYESLREHIVSSFLQTCEEVTTRCVTQVRHSQSLAVANVTALPSYEYTLTWEQSNHFCMIFLNDGSHVAIYRNPEYVPLSLKKLIYIQMQCQALQGPVLAKRIAANQFEVPDYSQMTHLQALVYLQTYARADTNLVEEYSDSDYVMTPDNFLKMNLIYLRVVSRLPVIIMGETGCGKTSLIRFFVQNVLKEHLIVVNVHAGVTSKKLAQRVDGIVQHAAATPSERHWVFFDEFNTSDCVGQVCEMLCETTFCGRGLPPNLVFLAACNPYRLRPKALPDDNVGIKKSARYRGRSAQSLMHVVKPLPESAIEYIWDFGALTDSDSSKYIEAMLKSLKCPNYEGLFSTLVYVSQSYFHTVEDVSSVSLRDVARFTILFRWFQHSLTVRKESREDQRFQEHCRNCQLDADWSVLENVPLCAGILALCNCYYYRLSQQTQRRAYLQVVAQQYPELLSPEFIEAVLAKNENDFIARMELPEATALNRAFRENVACMLHCIFCKIALFICGKPGCSKSLAIQLVFANLRGEKSMDAYFRTLPELVMVPFQGSESCTSEGIEKVFDRAKRFLTAGTHSILPVVVFDEIGLAEISKHNPLKVLHSLLELEHREIGFVGVSNWRLDASKMNRAMYLARPDPDREELVFTARSIYLACRRGPSLHEHLQLVQTLADAYFQYKEQLKGTKDADFFGLRDFYHLIKQTSAQLGERSVLEQQDLFIICKKAVERNFGGKAGASASVLRIVIQQRPAFEQFALCIAETPTLDLINENLADPRARFLMLICKGDIAAYAVEKYLQLPITARRMLVGSHMTSDESGEEYGFRSLSDIILYMEKGISVILKDMDHIYTSLYDLFNQNFAVSGGRRYCRVALGAQFNPRCFVHNDFHVIVFLSDDDVVLEQTDAPFLNRFEKHRFDIEKLFKAHQTERKLLISVNHVFPLYSQQLLKLLVLFLDFENASRDVLLLKCKLELLKMASQDVTLLAHSSILDAEEKCEAISMWNSLHAESFLSFLSALLTEGERNAVVFTYDTEILQHEQLSQLPAACVHQHFSAFRSEQDLVQDLVTFYRGAEPLYILDFSLAKEGVHLVMVKFTIERLAKEFQQTRKKVCLVVRLARNVPIATEVCWFDQWEIRSFNFCKHRETIITQEMVDMRISDFVREGLLYNFEEGVGKLTLEAYQTIVFQKSGAEDVDTSDHVFRLAEEVGKHTSLTEAIKAKLLALLETTEKPWVEEVLCRPDCVRKASTVSAAIKLLIELELTAAYSRLVYAIEKYGAFRSFFWQGDDSELLRTIWLRAFQELNSEISVHSLKQSNSIEWRPCLDFPFVCMDFFMLESIAEEEEHAFLQQFAERSIMRFHIADLSTAKKAQNLYFRDLIRLDLTRKPHLQEFEDVLTLIHTCWNSDTEGVEHRVWNYTKHREFGLAICELTAALCCLNSEILPRIRDSLSHFVGTNEELKEDRSEAGSEQSAGPAFVAANRQLSVLFNAAISEFFTSSAWLERCESVSKVSVALNKVYSLVNSLAAIHDFYVESFDEMDLFALAVQLLSTSPNALSLLMEVHARAVAITDQSFIYNPDFAKYLIAVLEANSAHSNRFKSVYFYKLLTQDNLAYLATISSEINSPNSEFWKHSASLLSYIAELAGDGAEQTAFIEELERVLRDASLSSRFSVLLGDTFYQSFHAEFSADSAHYLVAKEEDFVRHTGVISDATEEFAPLLMKLYASAFLRCYLSVYTALVHTDPRLSAAAAEAMRRVTAVLAGEQFPTSRVYALKCWKEEQRLSSRQLEETVRARPNVSWLSAFTFAGQRQVVPFISQGSYRVYAQTSICLRSILAGGAAESLSAIADSTVNSEDRAAFALAFLMHVFLSKEHSSQLVAVQLRSEERKLEEKLGSALSRLLVLFSTNFPDGSLLHLSATSSEEDVHRVLCLCHILVVLYTNTDSESPLTALLFDSRGNFRPDCCALLKESYIFGIGANPLYCHLQHLRDNFETLKSSSYQNYRYAKGSANRCSASCDYVYIIDRCGGPAELRQCPFCGSQIGGSNHTLVLRDGHQNLSDEEAVAFMKQRLDWYRENQERGVWMYEAGDSSSMALRGMSQTTHTVLHLLLTLSLYSLQATRFLSAQDLSVAIHSASSDVTRLLEDTVNRDYATVEKALNAGESYLWWYAVLRQLPAFMEMHRGELLTLEVRTHFEATFHAFLHPLCSSPIPTIKHETDLAGESLGDAESLLSETSRTVELYPLLPLFRLTRHPDFLSLKTQFELQQRKHEFPLLGLFLDMQPAICTLAYLCPLLDLTNALIDKFDHRIRREEARNRRIRDALRSDVHLSALFDRCSSAWDWLSTHELTFECHRLPAKQFSENEELVFFLLDRQEAGGGAYLTAAITELAEIQNTVMAGYWSAMEKKLGMDRGLFADMRKVPVQRVTSENVIAASMETIEDFEASFGNNPAYGEGRELIYNYERLEEQIQSAFEKGRLLTSDSITFVSYQFELLSGSSTHSSLISSIRRSIPQQPFAPEQRVVLDFFLGKQETDTAETHAQLLLTYYESLESLMCFLRSAPARGDMKVHEFAQQVNKFSLCEVYTRVTPLSQVQLRHIVALYEVLECRLFPYSQEFVKPEFRKFSEMTAKLLTRLDFPADARPIDDFVLVLMRLAMRMLIADIDPKQSIALYVIRPDLWAEDVTERQVEEFAGKLTDVQLANAMQVYDYLEAVARERGAEARKLELPRGKTQAAKGGKGRKFKGGR